MGWSGGAMVLGKLSVLGGPPNLIIVGAGGLFGHFFSLLSFLFSFTLSGRRPDIY